MMPQVYRVYYSKDQTTWTQLSNVESINAFVGRNSLISPFEPSRATITLRYPSGYASPITALVTGTWIKFDRQGGTYEMWRGQIRNVTANWGKPYRNSVGAADFLTIECEGAMAEWGRQSGYDTAVPADDLLTQMSTVAGIGNLQYGTTYTAATSPELAASTVSDSLLTWVNTAAASVGATLKDGSGILGLNTKDFLGLLPVSFSDVTNDSTHQVYDELTFDSLAQDYFTLVQVDMNTGSTVLSDAGIEPARTLRLSTFNASTAQAQDLADWYRGQFDTASFGISSISCTASAQNTFALEMGYGYWDIPGYRTEVTFRGSTYTMTILGVEFTADAFDSRFTYLVADADLTPYFYLDSDEYGVLDQNKLNW